MKIGGSGEIRTHGWLSPSPVFKTGAFNHSATLPDGVLREWGAAQALYAIFLARLGCRQTDVGALPLNGGWGRGRP